MYNGFWGKIKDIRDIKHYADFYNSPAEWSICLPNVKPTIRLKPFI